jgi:hypothetical protein
VLLQSNNVKEYLEENGRGYLEYWDEQDYQGRGVLG